MRRQDDMGDVSAFGTWSLVIKQKGVYTLCSFLTLRLTFGDDLVPQKLSNFISLHQTLLNSQLEIEKMKVEQERKKAIFTQEAVKEKVLNFILPSF